MKFSLSWLLEHLETTATVDDISNKLTSLGLEVESVDNAGIALKGFITAEIIAIEPHSQADRLQVCKVTTGHEILQIVCGAPNARLGLKTVLAPIGVTIPSNHLVLKPTKIRQVDSQGMLCSYAELTIHTDSIADGIIELDDDAPIGICYASYIGLDDTVFDIDVTPNRSDCLAIHGIARDLAAAGLGLLKPYTVPVIKATFKSPIKASFALPDQNQQVCSHFTSRHIKNVKNGPSPKWLQAKLQSVGLRSISALVDITNYMAVTWARPMHVFDADKIQGHLVVRLSKPGEKIRALDDKEYGLDDSITIIADDIQPLSIAGIMGGLSSGCTDDTVNVLLESANFDRIATTLAGRTLNIHTDSRARFERGVDASMVLPGLDIATQMIIDICGGEPSEIIEIGQPVCAKPVINFDYQLLLKRGGLNIPMSEVQEILQKLGFVIYQDHQSNVLQLTPPPWRHDISLPCDIVEEILRVKNYDTIPTVPIDHVRLNHGFESIPGSHQRRCREWITRRTLAARGLCEAMTWSFMRHDLAQKFGGGQAELNIENPINQDLSTMRPNLLPNLLAAASRNQSKYQTASALFEIGSQFADATPLGQHIAVAGIRGLQHFPRNWQGQLHHPDLFTVKQDVLEVLQACNVNVQTAQITTETSSWYHPNRSGNVMLGPKSRLATFGEIHPTILKVFDLQGPVYAFEINLWQLPKTVAQDQRTPLCISPYQAVERDLAFIVDDKLPAAKLLQIIHKIDKNLINNVALFDIYQDASLGIDKKSIAFTIRLQSNDRTLTEAEINVVMTKIIENINVETGGVLRS